ncbi:MAG: hypothetical protein ABI763_16940, partial [Bacteroidota bacterium]
TIEIPANITLTIIDSKLFACGDMWKGIVVDAGGKLNITNSEIADAEYGAFAKLTSTLTSIITVTNAIFNSNYIGIYIQPNAVGFNTINLRVTGTHFISSYNLKYSSNISPLGSVPYAGIYLNNLTCIIGSSFANQNQFNKQNIGIRSDKSVLTVWNSTFVRIRRDAAYRDYFDGSGIYASGNDAIYSLHSYGLGKFGPTCFDDCDYGIFIDGVSGFDRTSHMTNVSNGVYITNLAAKTSYSCFANHIECEWSGIESAFNPYADAISITGNTIDVNNIQGGGIGIGAYEIGASPYNFSVSSNTINLSNIPGFLSHIGIDVYGVRGLKIDHNLVHLNNVNNYAGVSLNSADKN